MLPFDRRLASLRSTRKQAVQVNDWRQLLHGDESRKQSIYSTANERLNQKHSSRRSKKACFCSRRLLLSIVITLFILIAQILLAHYYIGLNIGQVFRSQQSARGHDLDRLLESSSHNWICNALPDLEQVSKLARKFNVDLAIVDPDLLRLLLAEGQATSANDADEPVVVFSGATKTRISQEPDHKSIIHLAALNETSGGQPNLKLFYNSLKHFGYTSLKYDDASHTMPAEVYRRPSSQFDEAHLDAIEDLAKNKPSSLVAQLTDQESEVVSKIYTEFLSHVFILNKTTLNQPDEVEARKHCHGAEAATSSPLVIHLFVLYNYEYKPTEQWIQSSLSLNELDKHKLLRCRVHANDFRIPIEHYYVHRKRPLSSLNEIISSKQDLMEANSKQPSRLAKSLKDYKILEGFSGELSFNNNTYTHCEQSQFSISGLIDNSRHMSNYLRILDTAKPLEAGNKLQTIVNDQLVVAFKFMDSFSDSSSGGGFSFWLTGSTLLAYHKFCELAIMPSNVQFSLVAREEENSEADGSEEADGQVQAIENLVVNLELGYFASELNQSHLDSLAASNSSGITMISDWRKQANSYISFHFVNCPNLIFNLYAYELRSDFYQYYYITQSSMIMSHKFKKRKQQQKVAGGKRAPYIGHGYQHHVFTTSNLELCWTRIDYFHPFRVPCAVHEHLRRIFVV